MARIQAPPERYRASWARLVSDIVSPPVVWAVMAFPLALVGAISQRDAILASVLYGVLVCWIPVIFIAWMVKQGRITDIHMKVRRQRIIPFSVTILGATITLIVLSVWDVSPTLSRFTWITLIALAILASVTTVWQISIHAMGITSAIVTLGLVFGASVAFWFSPLIPLVAAARYKLKRHTLTQLVAGALVGAIVPMVFFIR